MNRFQRSTTLQSVGPRGFRAVIATSALCEDRWVLDMSGADLGRANSGRMPILDNHDPACLLGRWNSVRARGSELIGEGEFPPEGVSKSADEACAMLKAGFRDNLSIGF